jgi:hypothetical protein
MDAKVNLEFGNLHPLDEGAGESSDFAHSAARGIAAMLQDNPDMAALLEAMDESMRAEMIAGMADIIREAQAAEGESAPTPDMTAEE